MGDCGNQFIYIYNNFNNQHKMRRLLVFISIAIIVVSASYLTSFTSYKFVKGDTIENYHRFQKSDSNSTTFNWWGLLSPWQIEAQHRVTDTVYFTHYVKYPIAPVFKLVSPKDSTSEKIVAEEISNVIFDTINSIKLRLGLDYDGTSKEVRTAAQPKTLSLSNPEVKLTAIGTASPEAIKYGLLKSLQPGNVEQENVLLAKQRLERTMRMVQKNLIGHGVDSVKVLDLSSMELQLGSSMEAYQASKHPEMLDSLRFVAVNAQIIVERLEITPITAPIALPIWIGLGLLTFLLLRSLVGFILRRKFRKINLMPFLQALMWMIAIVAAVVLLVICLWLFRDIIFWILVIIGIFTFLWMVYKIIKNFREIYELLCMIKEFLWFLFLWILSTIFEIILLIILLVLIIIGIIIFLIISMYHRIINWWRNACTCCKAFVVLLIINLIFITSLLLGWCHIVWTF